MSTKIEWANHVWNPVVGGESGAKARPCYVDWIRSTVRQCRDAGVACFVKQFGRNWMLTENETQKSIGACMVLIRGVGMDTPRAATRLSGRRTFACGSIRR